MSRDAYLHVFLGVRKRQQDRKMRGEIKSGEFSPLFRMGRLLLAC
jgi:hypothetical protein